MPAIGLVHGCQRRLKLKWHAAKERESAVQSVVHEVLDALRTVTIFGQERRETERFLGLTRRSVAAPLRAVRTEGMLGALLALSTALGASAILYLGVRDVEAQVLSISDLLVVIAYIGQLYAPLQAIGTHVSGQQHVVASVERAFALIDRPLLVADRPNARPLERACGDWAERRRIVRSTPPTTMPACALGAPGARDETSVRAVREVRALDWRQNVDGLSCAIAASSTIRPGSPKWSRLNVLRIGPRDHLRSCGKRP